MSRFLFPLLCLGALLALVFWPDGRAAPGKSRLCKAVQAAALAVLFCFFCGFLPLRPTVIATGSMQPAIAPGDLVLTMAADAGSLRPGDIIGFRQEGAVVVHRIDRIEMQGGDPVFRTRGDANNDLDGEPVGSREVIGRVVLIIPGAGRPILWLRRLAAV